MRVPPGKAEQFSISPDASVKAVLVYGPDAGLVAERAQNLVRSIVSDAKDPFRVAEMTSDDLLGDPARLVDEAAALALGGGRRVIRLRQGRDAVTPVFSGFLPDPPGDALVVVEAGDLGKGSTLRKLFEQQATAAALACYRDDRQNLPTVIKECMADAGLDLAPDAFDYLLSNFGSDRQVTRRELEKLVLYMGTPDGTTEAASQGRPPGGGSLRTRIELEDVLACVGDSAALTLEDIALAVGAGDTAMLERCLQRSFHEGIQAISILRGVARHFQRLHLVAGLVSRGLSPPDALRKLRPPVFWKVAKAFETQAKNWSPKALAVALDKLLETEAACKRTAAPSTALTSRTLLELAARSPLRRRGRG